VQNDGRAKVAAGRYMRHLYDCTLVNSGLSGKEALDIFLHNWAAGTSFILQDYILGHMRFERAGFFFLQEPFPAVADSPMMQRSSREALSALYACARANGGFWVASMLPGQGKHDFRRLRFSGKERPVFPAPFDGWSQISIVRLNEFSHDLLHLRNEHVTLAVSSLKALIKSIAAGRPIQCLQPAEQEVLHYFQEVIQHPESDKVIQKVLLQLQSEVRASPGRFLVHLLTVDGAMEKVQYSPIF
jgi:hypothetical protein